MASTCDGFLPDRDFLDLRSTNCRQKSRRAVPGSDAPDKAVPGDRNSRHEPFCFAIYAANGKIPSEMSSRRE
ncbi:hypothetical protein KSP40_PGU020401 [Platanthera guangdongensis]|uniref:Uncharacterized protein n=1 Tax=Platanthera guangdongensis TaxID=2320717 RepID=A0ABR2N2D2_9ASPA